MSSYLDRAKTLRDQLLAMRRDLHQHPETSFEEVRTAKAIAAQLDRLGIPYKTGIAKTGIVANLGQGSPVIALRADMDALPIEEANDLPFKSKTPGKMHACGHDAHVACLLGAATMLAEDFKNSRLKGTVRLLFQPSEECKDAEGKSGGQRMVEENALAGIQAVVGLHVASTRPANQIFLREGPLMAAVDNFAATITGRGGHGANPHAALDPIWLAAQVITAIHGIVSRRKDPIEPGLITIGSIHAGHAANVIPVSVELTGTIRSFTKETRTVLHRELGNCFRITELFGGSYKLHIEDGYPVTVNHPEMTKFIQRIAAEIIGKENIHEMPPEPGSEDFSYMAQAAPGAFFFLGAKKDQTDRQHHAPNFDIDEAVLPTGAALMAQAAKAYLTEHAV